MRLCSKLLAGAAAMRLGSPFAYLVAVALAIAAVLLRLELDRFASSAQFITYYPHHAGGPLLVRCRSAPGDRAAVWRGQLVLCPAAPRLVGHRQLARRDRA